LAGQFCLFFSRQELTRQDAMFVGLFNVREKKKKENEKQSFAKDNDETISIFKHFSPLKLISC
jgi:hypothetical protein